MRSLAVILGLCFSLAVLLGAATPEQPKLIYTSNRTGSSNDIFLINPDGSEPKNLTNSDFDITTQPGRPMERRSPSPPVVQVTLRFM